MKHSQLPVASTYSTGGGGTVLEHTYGAVLLAALLRGDPITGLGDATPTMIRFQARPASQVDDFLVIGVTPAGVERSLSIGVRRRPRLTVGDAKSVQLLGDYVRTVLEHWPEIVAGRWRLQLAVSFPCPPAQQLRDLTEAARAAGGDKAFRQDAAAGRVNGPAMRRLREFDKIIESIAGTAHAAASNVGASELAWRVLASLSVITLRLEGGDDADRRTTVALLRQQTPDGLTATASDLFARLVEMAGTHAPLGFRVKRETIYSSLRGAPCLSAPPPDVFPALADGPHTWAERADALMRGPVAVIPGLTERVALAQSAVREDPDEAVTGHDEVVRALRERGYPGHATLYAEQFAKEMDDAGHHDVAAGILARMLVQLAMEGSSNEALSLRGQLDRLMRTVSAPVAESLKDTLSLHVVAINPLSDLSRLVEAFDSRISTAPLADPAYALVLAEAAVAAREYEIVAERADAFARVSQVGADELTRVRIELAVADATGHWDDLLDAARKQHLEPRHAALILARYARRLTIDAHPDEANGTWWEAINLAASAGLGRDAAKWLQAVQHNRMQYGPLLREPDEHRLARAMLIAGGSLLPQHEDHYTDALDAIRRQDQSDACESAQIALRNAVTFAHLGRELVASELLADILADAGEWQPASAFYVRAGRSEKLCKLAERIGDRCLILAPHLGAPAPWERRAAYKALAEQADLIADDDVEPIVEQALRDVRAGLAGAIRQTSFGRLEVAALNTVAGLADRVSPAMAEEILALLATLVPRSLHTGKTTDTGHVACLAAILSRDDKLSAAAAEQLLDLLALNESVSQNVLQIADHAIIRRADLFRERLPTLIETSFTAAWLLPRLGLTPPEGSVVVAQAFDTLVRPYKEPPGVHSMALPLGRNALLCRHLPQAECDRAARALLVRARDHTQLANNRSHALDAIRMLGDSLSLPLRAELFDAGIAFARGLEDGSALGDIAGPAHPLSRFKITLGESSLAVPGLLLAAELSPDVESAALVEAVAIDLLGSASPKSTFDIAMALRDLPPHAAALTPDALSLHSSPHIRALAARRWPSHPPHDPKVALRLARDPDFHVRISLAFALSQAELQSDDAQAAELFATLKSDPRASVRRLLADEWS